MHTHPYLDLQQGNLESYCMMVPKKEALQWYRQGWLAHYAVGLSRSDANRAWMISRLMRFQRDILLFNRPVLLTDKSVVGRTITGFSTHLGTYGMGGPGFFGLLLDTDEYLVYTAWYAGFYTLLDGRPIEVHPQTENNVCGWFCNFEQGWDDLSPVLNGCKITGCTFAEHGCTLSLEKGGATHVLEFVRQDGRIPLNCGEARSAYESGTITDYLMFQHKDAWLVV